MDLDSIVEKEFRLLGGQKKALDKLGIKKIRDLLFYFPSRYEFFSERKNISDIKEGDKTTVYGKIAEVKKEKSFYKKMFFAKITISDLTGIVNAVWFHQPYIASVLKIGDRIALTGKITKDKKGDLLIVNPAYEKINAYENLGKGAVILAIYPEARGITSRWIRFSIQKILKTIKEFHADPIPPEILNQYHLPSLKSSLICIHTPRFLKDAEAARKRFAFEEIFFIQIARLKQRMEHNKRHSFIIKSSKKKIKRFSFNFPF